MKQLLWAKVNVYLEKVHKFYAGLCSPFKYIKTGPVYVIFQSYVPLYLSVPFLIGLVVGGNFGTGLATWGAGIAGIRVVSSGMSLNWLGACSGIVPGAGSGVAGVWSVTCQVVAMGDGAAVPPFFIIGSGLLP
jgi:hypothetical protein